MRAVKLHSLCSKTMNKNVSKVNSEVATYSDHIQLNQLQQPKMATCSEYIDRIISIFLNCLNSYRCLYWESR